MKITVWGAGGWGTALATLLAEQHESVWLYSRNPKVVDEIIATHENSDYLPGVTVPDQLMVSADVMAALYAVDVLIIAVPSHAMRENVRKVAQYIPASCIVVSAVKGLEADTCKRMTTIIREEVPALADRVVVLSGPNHAEEVGRKIPSASVVASENRQLAESIQDILMTPSFRIYTNPDMLGVEIAGALKNVIALGTGIAEGLGFGDNSKAAFMTRGLTEITRLGVALGASAPTFSGLSGLGDLIATCTSRHSRNRRAGVEIGKGRTIEEIQADTSMVIEGVRATMAAVKLAAACGVEMPITQATYQVLYEGKEPREAVKELMNRGKRHEMEEIAQNSDEW